AVGRDPQRRAVECELIAVDDDRRAESRYAADGGGGGRSQRRGVVAAIDVDGEVRARRTARSRGDELECLREVAHLDRKRLAGQVGPRGVGGDGERGGAVQLEVDRGAGGGVHHLERQRTIHGGHVRIVAGAAGGAAQRAARG